MAIEKMHQVYFWKPHKQCNGIYFTASLASCSHTSFRWFWLIWGHTFHYERREKKGGKQKNSSTRSPPPWKTPCPPAHPLNLIDMSKTHCSIACKKKKRHTGLFIRGLGKERKTAGGCSLCASTVSLRVRTHYKDNTPHTCRLTWSAGQCRARPRWMFPGCTCIRRLVLLQTTSVMHSARPILQQVLMWQEQGFLIFFLLLTNFYWKQSVKVALEHHYFNIFPNFTGILSLNVKEIH